MRVVLRVTADVQGEEEEGEGAGLEGWWRRERRMNLCLAGMKLNASARLSSVGWRQTADAVREEEREGRRDAEGEQGRGC